MAGKIIKSKNAPAAVGPYSQAVMANGFLYVSGQLHIDPASGILTEGTTEELTTRCMENLRAILIEAGGDMENLIKVNIYTTDISAFAQINRVYASYFKDNPPARAVVEVSALPLGGQIEIEAVAHIEQEY